MQTPQTNLTAHTVALLRNRARSVTLANVEEKTDLKQSWLSALLYGQIKEPSADKIQRLYEFLSEKPLLPTDQN